MSTETQTAPRTSTPGRAGIVRRVLPRKVKEDTSAQAGLLWAVGTWVVTLLFFAPVAWMVLTSLHQEADAATNPPVSVSQRETGRREGRGIGAGAASPPVTRS